MLSGPMTMYPYDTDTSLKPLRLRAKAIGQLVQLLLPFLMSFLFTLIFTVSPGLRKSTHHARKQQLLSHHSNLHRRREGRLVL